jgi:hypothetical protein
MQPPRRIALRIWMGLFLVAYAVLLYRHTSRAVGGSDSSGYLNTAKLLAAGETSRPIPIPPEIHTDNARAFLPLGFLPRVGGRTMVPFYPIGFPAHLVAAAWIGGWRAAPFYVTPLAALATVMMTYVLARRFTEPLTAAFATLCLACCPILLFMSLQAMSDIVATAWCTAAVLAATSDRRLANVFAGVAIGVAVCVRPTSALMIVPVLLFLRPRRYAGAALGGLPFMILLLWFNWRVYGSPLASGYTQAGLLGTMKMSATGTRAASYLYWTLRQLGPAVLAGSIASLWIPYAPFRARLALASWFPIFLLFYASYDLLGPWWYTRFLLPAYPGLMVTAAITAQHLVDRRRRLALALAIAMGAVSLIAPIAFAREFGPLSVDEMHRPIILAASWLRREIPTESIVVTMEMSGALLYYTTHYPLRWDFVSAEEMRLYINSAAARGRGSWAILMDHEVDGVRARHGPLTERVGTIGPFQIFRLDRGSHPALPPHMLIPQSTRQARVAATWGE